MKHKVDTLMKSGIAAGSLVALLGLVGAGPALAVPVCAGTGHCYDTNTGQALGANTWPGAAAAAGTVSFNGQAGHLVTINSLAESQFIGANFGSFGWIGLSQNPAGVEPGTPAQGAAGGWQWVTGEPFYQSNTNTAADVIFHNWGGGEPNDLGGEDFGHFNGGGNASGNTWNDLPGTPTLNYLIEFEPAGIQATPEPATLAILGLGLAGLGFARRRRN